MTFFSPREKGSLVAFHFSSRRLTPLILYSRYVFTNTAPRLAATVSITYVEADGTEKEVQAELGKNLLDVAHENNIELEGGLVAFFAVLCCW